MNTRKKFQVFVSSTYKDLLDERQAAVEAILSSGHIPAGMELFTAGDESQMHVINRWIEESDVYLLILGGRYGSIEPTTGKSYTHLEYEYALSLGKPIFSVVITDNALEKKVQNSGTSMMEKEEPRKLKDFRKQVLLKMVKFYDEEKDIKLSIYETLSEFERRKEILGWVRADEQIETTELTNEITRLSKENSELRRKVNSSTFENITPYNNGLSHLEIYQLLEKEIIPIDKFRIEEIAEIKTLLKEWNTNNFTALIYFIWKIDFFYEGNFWVQQEALTGILVKLDLLNRFNSYRHTITDDGKKFYLKYIAK